VEEAASCSNKPANNLETMGHFYGRLRCRQVAPVQQACI